MFRERKYSFVWLNHDFLFVVCMAIVIDRSFDWLWLGYVFVSWRVIRKSSQFAWVASLFWKERHVWQACRLVPPGLKKGYGRLLPTSQTLAAVCQMAASVSDSGMPTAIKNFSLENRSFNSRPIWWSGPLGLWSFQRPGSRKKADGKNCKIRNACEKGRSPYLIL